ncbi:hypothetical protein ACSMXN_15370 [Jatrophihabitans sp. DSM 45814]
MHKHMSLRERLSAFRDGGAAEPVFEKTEDPTLAAFAQLFADSGLFAFDANKQLRTGALTPLYDCSTESRAQPDSEPETFIAIWTPVWQSDDPVSGFRTGHDSAYLGSTPTIPMPPDERTAALLLLVTSTFVHLSGSQEDSGPLVRGAVEGEDNTYRFFTFEPTALVEPEAAAADRQRDSAGTL